MALTCTGVCVRMLRACALLLCLRLCCAAVICCAVYRCGARMGVHVNAGLLVTIDTILRPERCVRRMHTRVIHFIRRGYTLRAPTPLLTLRMHARSYLLCATTVPPYRRTATL